MRGFTITGAAALAVFCFASPVRAALPEWRAVTPFEINNPGIALSGVQVELTINTQTLISGGLLEADADDMRFASDCAGDELIPFWIQPGTLGTTSTRVWVVLDLPANGPFLLRMFHDNPPAPHAEAAIGEVFDGPHSATNQITGGMTNSAVSSQRGFRFSPARDILVTEFGKNEPDGTTRTVKLWNVVGSAVLETQQISGAAGVYSYGPLAQPMWLDDGGNYILSIFQDAAGPRYFFQPSTQISPYLTYGEMRYCGSCTADTFPTEILTGYHYGYPDLRFYLKQDPLQPPTVNAAVSCTADATCDADCSATICGDGELNLLAGEECDDGSIINGDGCSSTCLIELEPGSSSGGASAGSDTGEGTTAGTDGPTSGDPTDDTTPTMTDPVSTSDGATSNTPGSASDPTTDPTGSEATDGGTGTLPGLPSRGLGPTGCACSTPATSPWGAPALLVLLGLRRRRKRRK